MSSPFRLIKCCICEFIWPTHKVYCSHPFLTSSVSVTRLKHLVFSLETISNFESMRELNGSIVQDGFRQCVLMTAYIGRLFQHLVRQKNCDFCVLQYQFIFSLACGSYYLCMISVFFFKINGFVFYIYSNETFLLL